MRPFQAEGQRHCLFSLRAEPLCLRSWVFSRDSCLGLSGEEPISARLSARASLWVTLGVPKSLSETPQSPEVLAQGGWEAGRGTAWERAHSPLERDALPLPARVPKGAAFSGASQPGLQLPRQVWPSLGAHPLLLTSPLFGSGPLSAQRPLPGVMSSVPPSRVCPPSLAWCLQLWSPPPPPGQPAPPSSGQLPRSPSPALGKRGGSPGLPHPESQDALPVLAQLTTPFPRSPPTQRPPERLRLEERSSTLPPRPPVLGSVLSLAMWWQRRVGGLSGHRPLCASLTWLLGMKLSCSQVLTQRARGRFRGWGWGAPHPRCLSLSHLSVTGSDSSGGMVPAGVGARGG